MRGFDCLPYLVDFSKEEGFCFHASGVFLNLLLLNLVNFLIEKRARIGTRIGTLSEMNSLLMVQPYVAPTAGEATAKPRSVWISATS